MAKHSKHEKKKHKEPGTGLKFNKRQKKNFEKFQEGFRSKFGIKKKIISLAFLFLMCYSSTAFSQDRNGSIKFAWDANPVSDEVTGYQIHSGLTSGNYDTVTDVKNVTNAKLSKLTKGTLYYAVLTAYDAAYNVSDYSIEVSAIAKDQDAPGKPAMFKEVDIVNIRANIVNLISARP
jgi:hypothetical protein